MNKKFLLCIVYMALFGGLVACGNTSISMNEKKEDNIGLEEKKVKVSLEDAIAKFKNRYPEGEIFSISMKNEQEKLEYRIGSYIDSAHYIVRIDTGTGEITKEEQEKNTLNEEKNFLVLNEIKEPKEVMETAIESAGADFKVVEWNLEKFSNRTTYKVKMRHKVKDVDITEVKIDAKTGYILIQ